jgi:hypothetical protein
MSLQYIMVVLAINHTLMPNGMPDLFTLTIGGVKALDSDKWLVMKNAWKKSYHYNI